MHKFAHISDCHLGFQSSKALRQKELHAFKEAMDTCMEKGVDFIIISGDLFHANIPNMNIANRAAQKLHEVRESGIPIYVVYGSHDYSPNNSSIVDLLVSAGVLTKIVKAEPKEGALKLRFTEDQKTGAKLAGMSARRRGLERDYFERLDHEVLKREKGFKIFVFHSAISELKPEFLADMDSIPASMLPPGFDYYAGGHLHKAVKGKDKGHPKINFPGPLFAGYPKDLELNAKDEKRGFFIVYFDDQVEKVERVNLDIGSYEFLEHDAEDKASDQVQKELKSKIDETQPENKIVLMKVKGRLASGKTSDIDFQSLTKRLYDMNALFVKINRSGLRSKEYEEIEVRGENAEEIEKKLFEESIGSLKPKNEILQGKKGVNLSLDLLHTLGADQPSNETKKDYEERIVKEGLEKLGLGEVV